MLETPSAPSASTSRFPKPLRRGAACLNCRRSKQACDAVKPECGSCTLRGRKCEYASFLGPLRKREQKLLELESQLEKEISSVESRSGSEGARTAVADGSVTSDDTRSASSPSQSNGSGSGSASARDSASPSSSSGYPYDPERVVANLNPANNKSPNIFASIWKKSPKPPPSITSNFPSQMLQIFLPYRDHFTLDIDAQHWLHAIALPPSNPSSLHPCLLNAICLIGCSLERTYPIEWETHYFRRAREEMQSSLSLCDRIEDWLYTNVILMGYMLLRGRPEALIEFSQAAVPIAVACNLHQLSPPSQFATQSYGLLAPARDPLHALDRINLWWTLWVLDKRGAIAADLNQAFPYRDTTECTTPMPLPRSTIETLGIQFCPWRTLQEILIPPHTAMDASADSALGLRVKSTFVLSEAVRAANVKLGRSNVTDWTPITTQDAYITVFLDTVPHNETAYSIVSEVPLKPLLARTTLSVLCGAVILFGIGSEVDRIVYARRLAAARWMASLYREIQSYKPYPYRYICNAPFWACGRGVIEEEISKAQANDGQSIECGMAYVERLMEELRWMNDHLHLDDSDIRAARGSSTVYRLD